MILNICVKFHEDISNVFQVTKRKLLFSMFKGHKSKIIKARVMILALCMLSNEVLYLCKVSSKYNKWYSTYTVETVVLDVQRGITPELYVMRTCIKG